MSLRFVMFWILDVPITFNICQSFWNNGGHVAVSLISRGQLKWYLALRRLESRAHRVVGSGLDHPSWIHPALGTLWTAKITLFYCNFRTFPAKFSDPVVCMDRVYFVPVYFFVSRFLTSCTRSFQYAIERIFSFEVSRDWRRSNDCPHRVALFSYIWQTSVCVDCFYIRRYVRGFLPLFTRRFPRPEVFSVTSPHLSIVGSGCWCCVIP